MLARKPETEVDDLAKQLLERQPDANATHTVLKRLNFLFKHHPVYPTPKTIDALRKYLKKAPHASHRLSFFLYRAVVRVMMEIIVNTTDKTLAADFVRELVKSVNTRIKSKHQGVTEALGSFPLKIKGPEIQWDQAAKAPVLTWEKIIAGNGASTSVPQVAGRSIIYPLDEKNVRVVKLAFDGYSARAIQKEALWMEFICENAREFEEKFYSPVPVKIEGNYLFRLENLPPHIAGALDKDSVNYYGISYKVHKSYFFYPNDHRNDKQLGLDDFRAVMFRNARLLGRLGAMGIIQTAPIPLFHNRVQRDRRNDSGLYRWWRRGRLDRWLYSCRYPNFGLSGIRDFEHFISHTGGGRKLYRHIATHLLSLILVICSYFRNLEPDQVGYDSGGVPLDMTHLFDKEHMAKLVLGVFYEYYRGFTRSRFSGELPAGFDHLISRIIQEMGVDHHMVETLRYYDQKEMTEDEFQTYLKRWGYSEDQVVTIEKGKTDLPVLTGPHLGEFNGQVSIPELIEFLETTSALCVAGRFVRENGMVL